MAPKQVALQMITTESRTQAVEHGIVTLFGCEIATSFYRNLSRHNSWPLSSALERAFREEASGYGFAANCQLPSFLRMQTSIVQNEDSTDSDMPAMLCGWCNGINCNGIHLSYCRTWQYVSAQLNLDTLRLRRSYNSE